MEYGGDGNTNSNFCLERFSKKRDPLTREDGKRTSTVRLRSSIPQSMSETHPGTGRLSSSRIQISLIHLCRASNREPNEFQLDFLNIHSIDPYIRLVDRPFAHRDRVLHGQMVFARTRTSARSNEAHDVFGLGIRVVIVTNIVGYSSFEYYANSAANSTFRQRTTVRLGCIQLHRPLH